VNGSGFKQDTEVFINEVKVTALIPSDPEVATRQRIVNLDDNLSIRNMPGVLTAKARHSSPQSDFSNEVTAGRLVGPEITSIRPKRKKPGALILKITGANFQQGVTARVLDDAGREVSIRSVSFVASDSLTVKIGSGSAPPSGARIRVRVVTAGGVVSNEFALTLP
jgi:hypothetical protein